MTQYQDKQASEVVKLPSLPLWLFRETNFANVISSLFAQLNASKALEKYCDRLNHMDIVKIFL